MKKTTLVVMAAGIGSRFGGGIKQLEPVGPSGEIIMDYSIYDALEAGFNKVVFIIRKDLEKDFREVIGNRMEKIVETAYAFQEVDELPAGFTKPEGRTKPWGTGQAILACKDIVKEPFAVINADDYYGKEAFVKVHDYLVEEHPASDRMEFCMAGFHLGNTLSENGGVTRGVCSVDNAQHLTKVTETKNIVKTADGAEADGKVLDCNSLVSMNMWGLTPDFLKQLEQGFEEFFEKTVPENPLKSEYLIPIYIGELLEKGEISVKVLPTNDTWYGMTYKEDVALVKESFRKMLEAGVYKADLFADL